MELFSNYQGAYMAQWGLTDFYDDAEAILRPAIESGQPFDTGWFGCKKEIRTGRIVFDGKLTRVQATSESDELLDLLDTVVWKACGGNEYAGSGHEALVKLLGSEEAADARMQALFDEHCPWYDEVHTAERSADGHLDWEATMGLLDAAEDEAANGGTVQFGEMVELVKDELGV